MKTFYKYLFVIILIIYSSCKNSEKENEITEIKITETPEITEKFKLEFLNEILSNKNDNYLFPYDYKTPYLMFNSFEYTGNKDVAFTKALGKPSTLPEFITHFFKESDTTFIINQIKKNETFDVFKLSEYGHNIVDWSKIRYYDDNYKEVKLVSEDSIQKLVADNEKEGQLMLRKPIFNKKLNKAYIAMGYFMSHTSVMLYSKENGTWKADEVMLYLVN